MNGPAKLAIPLREARDQPRSRSQARSSRPVRRAAFPALVVTWLDELPGGKIRRFGA